MLWGTQTISSWLDDKLDLIKKADGYAYKEPHEKRKSPIKKIDKDGIIMLTNSPESDKALKKLVGTYHFQSNNITRFDGQKFYKGTFLLGVFDLLDGLVDKEIHINNAQDKISQTSDQELKRLLVRSLFVYSEQLKSQIEANKSNPSWSQQEWEMGLIGIEELRQEIETIELE
jgi:hypothetical protein